MCSTESATVHGPEDITQLRQIGVVAYLNQQLAPDTIVDDALGARLAAFETQRMSTAELVEKFFRPALMERRTDQFRPRSRADTTLAGAEEWDPTGVQRARAAPLRGASATETASRRR